MDPTICKINIYEGVEHRPLHETGSYKNFAIADFPFVQDTGDKTRGKQDECPAIRGIAFEFDVGWSAFPVCRSHLNNQ